MDALKREAVCGAAGYDEPEGSRRGHQLAHEILARLIADDPERDGGEILEALRHQAGLHVLDRKSVV